MRLAAGAARPLGARPAPRALAPLPKTKPSRMAAVRVAAEQNGATATQPQVVVKIDNETDPFATMVHIEYGDLLGELLDTVTSLKALGLNIRRAKIRGDERGHTFYVTDQARSEKIVTSAKYHPETGEQLAWSAGHSARVSVRDADPTQPLGRRTRSIVTQLEIREAPSGAFSTLIVNTVDRPGLLTDIVRVLKDINLNVISAEVDTVGRNAFDKFNLTYHGEPLSEPMCQLCINSLQYYLSQNEDSMLGGREAVLHGAAPGSGCVRLLFRAEAAGAGSFPRALLESSTGNVPRRVDVRADSGVTVVAAIKAGRSVGPQIYTCNGTSWVNTNSNVSFSCTGTGAGTTGVHNVIGGVPSYTFNCGFVQGNTSNQIMVPKPNGAPTDLPIYRRSAINGSGCVMGIEASAAALRARAPYAGCIL
eukprot:scaffold3.g6689.t1